MRFIGTELETSPHIHFYAIWCHVLLKIHGLALKRNSNEVMPVFNLLQKTLLNKSKDIAEICEKNKYSIQFLLAMGRLKQAKAEAEQNCDSESDDTKSDASSSDHSVVDDMELQSKWSDNDE